MRALTIINLVLWLILCALWAGYTAAVGIDTISLQVGWILLVAAALMGLLALIRVRRGRPVLG